MVCFPFYRFNLQSDLHQFHVTGFHIMKETVTLIAVVITSYLSLIYHGTKHKNQTHVHLSKLDSGCVFNNRYNSVFAICKPSAKGFVSSSFLRRIVVPCALSTENHYPVLIVECKTSLLLHSAVAKNSKRRIS